MASIWLHPHSKFYSACFRLPNGKRTKRSTKLTSKDEAMELARKWEKESTPKLTALRARKVIADIYKTATGATLPQHTTRSYFEKWLIGKKAGVGGVSMEKYQSALNEFLTFIGSKADADIAGVEFDDLDSFKTNSLATLSAKTSKNKMVIIRQALHQAWVEGYIFDDIARRVSPIVIKSIHQQKRTAFSMEQVGEILAHAKGEWHGMCLFGFYTGQRLSDIASFTWDNVDSKAKVIRFKSRKTDRPMVIPLMSPLMKWLNKNSKNKTASAPIFPNAVESMRKNKGKAAALSKQFRAILAEVGVAERRPSVSLGKGRHAKREISPLSFHSFRHTLTTELKKQGASHAVVQDIIGHDSELVSNLYTHVNDTDKRKCLDLLPSLAG